LAAIGQCRLISLWDSLFGHLRQPIAQILLTRNDIADVRGPKVSDGTELTYDSALNTSMLKIHLLSCLKWVSSLLLMRTIL
jgi:hypothetical protein